MHTRKRSTSSFSSSASETSLTKSEQFPLSSGKQGKISEFKEVDLQPMIESLKHVSFMKSVDSNEASSGTCTHEGPIVRIPNKEDHSNTSFQVNQSSFIIHGESDRITARKSFLYIDDMIVIGRTETENIENLGSVCKILRERNLKLNAEKCKFF